MKRSLAPRATCRQASRDRGPAAVTCLDADDEPGIAGSARPRRAGGVMFNTLLRLDFTGRPPQAPPQTLALASTSASTSRCMYC